jgi:hypothetical protein
MVNTCFEEVQGIIAEKLTGPTRKTASTHRSLYHLLVLVLAAHTGTSGYTFI